MMANGGPGSQPSPSRTGRSVASDHIDEMGITVLGRIRRLDGAKLSFCVKSSIGGKSNLCHLPESPDFVATEKEIKAKETIRQVGLNFSIFHPKIS